MGDTKVRRITGLSNLEFFKRYAKPGCVGLFGGSSAIDRAIRRGQKELDAEGRASLWSHAAVFEGQRIDGRQWLIESDFEVGKGQVGKGGIVRDPATQSAAEQAGFGVSYVAKTHLGTALAAELGDRLSGKSVFLPRSDRANPDQANSLKYRGHLGGYLERFRDRVETQENQ